MPHLRVEGGEPVAPAALHAATQEDGARETVEGDG